MCGIGEESCWPGLHKPKSTTELEVKDVGERVLDDRWRTSLLGGNGTCLHPENFVTTYSLLHADRQENSASLLNTGLLQDLASGVQLVNSRCSLLLSV